MISCPKCSAQTKTVETRAAGKGALTYTRRRRECEKCRHRITTSEVIIHDAGTSGVMLIKTSTLETMLRMLVSELGSRTGDDRGADFIATLLAGDGRTPA